MGATGPDLRYVKDPLHFDNVVIDMRHMLVVGKLGTKIGKMIEWGQGLSKRTSPSAENPQDYYSNALGSGFYNYLNSLRKYEFTYNPYPVNTCTNCQSLENQDSTKHLTIFLNSKELRDKFVPKDEYYDSVNKR